MKKNPPAPKKIRYTFFGTPDVAVSVLEKLCASGFSPALIVSAPDRPRGRGLKVAPSPIKRFAIEHMIPVITPESFSDTPIPKELLSPKEKPWDVFLVVAYGKILPKQIIDMPRRGTLNLHFSLLPKYRGAAPIEAQILNNERDLGISILQIDEKLDHGPIVAEQKLILKDTERPFKTEKLKKRFAEMGSDLLVKVLPLWVRGDIEAKEQDHEEATYAPRINKEDARIDLSDDPYKNFLKICAYDTSPRAHFLDKRGKRVIVADAQFQNGTLIITRVIPEGKKEMDYNTYLRMKAK